MYKKQKILFSEKASGNCVTDSIYLGTKSQNLKDKKSK